MKPLLLQSNSPAESPWVPSKDCKGLRFRGADQSMWFKVHLDIKGGPRTLDLNGPRRKGEEHTFLFNGVQPHRVKVIFVQGGGPVDVDLI